MEKSVRAQAKAETANCNASGRHVKNVDTEIHDRPERVRTIECSATRWRTSFGLVWFLPVRIYCSMRTGVSIQKRYVQVIHLLRFACKCMREKHERVIWLRVWVVSRGSRALHKGVWGQPPPPQDQKRSHEWNSKRGGQRRKLDFVDMTRKFLWVKRAKFFL